jgi:hypothetical protein
MSDDNSTSRLGSWLCRIAFVLAVALVGTRVLIAEAPRDAISSPDAPAAPGAAAGVILDWLGLVPALLVMIRRLSDPGFRLKWSSAHAIVIALGLLASASTLWSSDAYLTLVTSTRLVSTGALAWAFTQLVRSHRSLRVVAGVCFGLLLVNAAEGLLWRYDEWPAMVDRWQTERATFFTERGWDPQGFAAQRFEQKLMAGEIMGFTTSPNTFAAVVVFLALIATGAALQRWRDETDSGWVGLVALALPVALLLLSFTHSRAGIASLGLGMVLLLMWRWLGDWLGKRHAIAFWSGVIVVMLAATGLVAIGLSTGELPGDSLNFRWRYWVGAWGVFESAPVLGVGWSNFADAYLAERVAAAAEEIKDPHNALMRLLAELGVVGALLGVAFAWTASWSMTRAADPADTTPAKRPPMPASWAISLAGAIATGAVLAGVDLTAPPSFVTVEVITRILYGALLALGIAAVVIRSRTQTVVDDKPAPWILASMTIATGVMFVHSMVDMVVFEPGPMMLAAMVGGAVVGVRKPEPTRSRPMAAVILPGIATILVMVAALIAIVLPVVLAERMARSADRMAMENFAIHASRRMEEAFDVAPVPNVDFALRAASHAARANDHATALRLADRAVEASGRSVPARLTRARLRLLRAVAEAELDAAMADYERASMLNPNDVSIAIEYANALERLARRQQAAAQIERAMAVNDGLDPAEPERLSAGEVDALRERLRTLKREQPSP